MPLGRKRARRQQQDVFIWTTKEGVRLKVTQMTDSHLANTDRFLGRRLLSLTAQKAVGTEMLGLLKGTPLTEMWQLLWSTLARLYVLGQQIRQCEEARNHIQAEMDSRGLLQVGRD